VADKSGLLNKITQLIPKRLRDTIGVRLWAFAKVPLLNWVRPQIIELNNKTTVVKIPLRRRTKNHLNSMYFGVLACGADIAGGLIAIRLIKQSNENISLVFKDFKADFLKRPEADTLFTCTDGENISKMIEETVRTGERVNQTVSVIATCPHKFGDEPVAVFELTLSLKKR
jgi:acyl-coenzyme A thioesterase PaaI-like protein